MNIKTSKNALIEYDIEEYINLIKAQITEKQIHSINPNNYLFELDQTLEQSSGNKLEQFRDSYGIIKDFIEDEIKIDLGDFFNIELDSELKLAVYTMYNFWVIKRLTNVRIFVYGYIKNNFPDIMNNFKSLANTQIHNTTNKELVKSYDVFADIQNIINDIPNEIKTCEKLIEILYNNDSERLDNYTFNERGINISDEKIEYYIDSIVDNGVTNSFLLINIMEFLNAV